VEIAMSTDRMERIKAALAALDPLHLDLLDESHLHAGHAGAQSGRGHFRLSICSARFSGLNAIARHRLVYQSLGEMMQTDIHALSITARAPEEA
jgi:BolA family transcriptional regulator, general stress-responsive regulator